MIYQPKKYEWKVNGVMNVSAQVAGETLEEIYNRTGDIKAETIVNESRSEDAPLHSCFEWNDETAAEEYRKSQANNLKRLLVTTIENEGKEISVRAVVTVNGQTSPIERVLKTKDMRESLIAMAKKELANFKNKYKVLEELAPIFEAIEKITGTEE